MNSVRELLSQKKPLIMGILNVTPDSFYDGGKYMGVNMALNRAEEIISAGADIIDIGGESSRPGSEPISENEEIDRVIPVIEAVRRISDICISVDTVKPRVAKESIALGANVINDISSLRFDCKMIDLVKENQVELIMTHMLGTPKAMQDNPVYSKWVVDEITVFFEERINYATSNGVALDKIIIDPGIGFGKTLDNNLDIIANISHFKKFGLPLLLGHSNKRFISGSIGCPIESRVWGTAGVTAYAVLNGADILRVHDIKEMVMVCSILKEIMKKRKNILESGNVC